MLPDLPISFKPPFLLFPPFISPLPYRSPHLAPQSPEANTLSARRLTHTDTERPRALNAPEVLTLPSRSISSSPNTPLLTVQSTVRTQGLSIFLQHIRIEEVALEWVVVASEDSNPLAPNSRLGILCILRRSERSADSGIVWTREKTSSDAGAGVVVCISSITLRAAVLRCLPAWLSCGSSGISLLISVGGGDDDLEGAPFLARVGRCSRIDTRPPECTLVICDRGWVGAVVRWVEGRIALDEGIEAGAESCVVAVCAT